MKLDAVELLLDLDRGPLADLGYEVQKVGREISYRGLQIPALVDRHKICVGFAHIFREMSGLGPTIHIQPKVFSPIGGSDPRPPD